MGFADVIGVGQPLRENAVFNLGRARVMVVDDDDFSLELTVQALQGFGARIKYALSGALEAIEVLSDHDVDLLVVDCEMPGMDGYDFVRWLRRSNLDPNAYAPVIMTASHVRRAKVLAARDCGANFLVTKPFSASTLLERIVWVAGDARPFLQVGDYFGPDRRFRDDAPPGEIERRSHGVRPKAPPQEADNGEAA